jgi:hypothetical protein
VYSDKELTNEIYDFVLLDVHSGSPYPETELKQSNIDKAIMGGIDKWLAKTTDRIEIEVGMWESAPCPIYTGNITRENLEKAEQELYGIMCHYYRWNKEDVNRLLKGIGDANEIEDFKDAVCKEEEVLIMNYGGVYYEDMSEEEYNSIIENDDVEHCKIVTLIEEIAKKNDELRDLFLELSNIIAMREFMRKQTIIDDNFNIKSADLGKFKESLEEIRKFVLFV